jgi:hypothetical protein
MHMRHDVAKELFIVSISRGVVNTTNVLRRSVPLWLEKWWIAVSRTMPHGSVSAGAPPFGWIPLLHPTRNALVKDPQIPISFGGQFFIGQTGQFVWTRSIEND